MLGQSPSSMMRGPQPNLRRSAGQPMRRRRGLQPWAIAALAVIALIALALIWVWLWYYAAQTTDRTLAGWIEREAAAGRVYSCGTQSIGGFPLRIEVHCEDAGAALNRFQPPYAVKAAGMTVATEVYQPTRLLAEITGPLTVVAQAADAPRLVADWSRAQLTVRGLPPDPQSLAVALERPHLDRVPAAGGTDEARLFNADHVDLQARVISGSPSSDPVIETVVHLKAAAAPRLHELTTQPTDVAFDAVLRGFKDLRPKPWAERFRAMQAAGGGIEIKYLRISQADALIVGTGKLSVSAQGRLDGLLRVAVVGIESIVPRLGIDRVIGRGVNRIAGMSGNSSQGLDALDRLVPGLSGAVRDSATANIVDNLKKMGERTEIDNKDAIILPLRIADGAVYLGMVPIGNVPPLF
jgi:hypothetical protein